MYVVLSHGPNELYSASLCRPCIFDLGIIVECAHEEAALGFIHPIGL